MAKKAYKILLVEDDYLYEEFVTQKIREVRRNTTIQVIVTESDFRNSLDDIVNHPPDAIIMDCMLPWENPKPNPSDRPQEVEQEGVTRAGIRCIGLLRDKGVSVETILFSALPEEELKDEINALPRSVTFQSKNTDILPFLKKVLSEHQVAP